MRQIRDAEKRAFRLFKSISCVGDLFRVGTDEQGRRVRGWFLTFTYRPGVDWAPGHIKTLNRYMRRWAHRRGAELRVLWVAEQHKSGRIHFHAIVFLPPNLAMPFPDRQGWWPHGMTQREKLRKESVGYLIKYATKCQDVSRPWPKGMRLHGHAGLNAAQRIRRAWWVLPKYIREQVTPYMRVRRARGGGWWSPVTLKWWPAWGVAYVGTG